MCNMVSFVSYGSLENRFYLKDHIFLDSERSTVYITQYTLSTRRSRIADLEKRAF